MQTYIYTVIVIEIAVLLVPLACKIFKQREEKKRFISTATLLLSNLFFIIVWVAAGFGTSFWLSIVIFPLDEAGQTLTVLVSQAFWLLVGFILAFSKKATLGASLGAVGGILIAILPSLYIGISLFGLIVADQDPSYNFGMKDDLSVIGILATMAFLVVGTFVVPITSLTGAAIGFIIDIFQILNKRKNRPGMFSENRA